MGDCWNFKRLLKLAGTESKVAFAASRNILLCCSFSIEGLRIQIGLFSNANQRNTFVQLSFTGLFAFTRQSLQFLFLFYFTLMPSHSLCRVLSGTERFKGSWWSTHSQLLNARCRPACANISTIPQFKTTLNIKTFG